MRNIVSKARSRSRSSNTSYVSANDGDEIPSAPTFAEQLIDEIEGVTGEEWNTMEQVCTLGTKGEKTLEEEKERKEEKELEKEYERKRKELEKAKKEHENAKQKLEERGRERTRKTERKENGGSDSLERKFKEMETGLYNKLRKEFSGQVNSLALMDEDSLNVSMTSSLKGGPVSMIKGDYSRNVNKVNAVSKAVREILKYDPAKQEIIDYLILVENYLASWTLTEGEFCVLLMGLLPQDLGRQLAGMVNTDSELTVMNLYRNLLLIKGRSATLDSRRKAFYEVGPTKATPTILSILQELEKIGKGIFPTAELNKQVFNRLVSMLSEGKRDRLRKFVSDLNYGKGSLQDFTFPPPIALLEPLFNSQDEINATFQQLVRSNGKVQQLSQLEKVNEVRTPHTDKNTRQNRTGNRPLNTRACSLCGGRHEVTACTIYPTGNMSSNPCNICLSAYQRKYYHPEKDCFLGKN